MTSVEETKNKLKQSYGAEFFELLEKFIDFKIPIVIRNILSVTLYNSAYAFCNFDEKSSLNEIESFMRNDFSMEMVPVGDSKENYLGYYSNAQEKFKLICGQIKIICNIGRECQNLYENHKTQKTKPNEVNPPVEMSVTVKLLFTSVYQWMKSNQQLRQTAEQDLDFKVKKSSTVIKSDGSISVFMKCPISTCMDGFTATFKGYPRQNPQKSRSTSSSSRSTQGANSVVTPRWNYASMRQHLLKYHGTDENRNSNSSVDDDSNYGQESDTETSSNGIRETESRRGEESNVTQSSSGASDVGNTDEPQSISNSQNSGQSVSSGEVQAVVRRKLRDRNVQPTEIKKRKRNQ